MYNHRRSFNWIDMGGAKQWTEADHRRATAEYVKGMHVLRIEGVGVVARVRTRPELESAFCEYLSRHPFQPTPSPASSAYLDALKGY